MKNIKLANFSPRNNERQVQKSWEYSPDCRDSATFQVQVRRAPQGHNLSGIEKGDRFVRIKKRGSRKTSDWQDGIGKGRQALGRGVETTRSSFRCHLASLRFFPNTPLQKIYSPHYVKCCFQSAVHSQWRGCVLLLDSSLGGLAYPPPSLLSTSHPLHITHRPPPHNASVLR